MSEFFLDDGLGGLFDVSPSSVAKSLTKENVIALVRRLGATTIVEQEDCLILPTICHNAEEVGKSNKLYYYFDSQLFTCYTECGCSFNIYELVKKVHSINDHDISFYEAFNYVSSMVGRSSLTIAPTHTPIGNRYARKLSVERLPEYNKNVLAMFRRYLPIEWTREGITQEAADKFSILFSPSKLKVVIPHFDMEGRLVGIRGRALDEWEAENYGKYMPIKAEQDFFTHHLSRNLYGVWENGKAIRKYKRAVVFEAEKSVLLSSVYYGDDSVAVAVCGSNLHKVQVDILTKKMGVSEIILAFDREYASSRSEEAQIYKEKLFAICQKYSSYANFYMLWDMEGLLKQKDSPIDRGKEVYERLYDMKVRIR